MDFNNNSVSEECAIVCADATYGELTKTESEEEAEVNYNMTVCANYSMSLEKKRR